MNNPRSRRLLARQAALTYLALLMAYQAIILALNPAIAWDVLSSWGPAVLDMLGLEGQTYNPNIFIRHTEMFVNILAALPRALKAIDIGIAIPVSIVTTIVYMSSAVTLYFLFSRLMEKPIPLLFLILLFSMPIIENHMLLHGYIELMLSSVILFTLFWLVYTLQYVEAISLMHIFFGFIAILLMVSLKNIGLLFAIAVLVSLGMYLISVRYALTAYQDIIMLVACATIFLLWPIVISKMEAFSINFGLEWHFINYENKQVELGGYTLEYGGITISKASIALNQALFKNSSFGTLCVALIFLSASYAANMYRRESLIIIGYVMLSMCGLISLFFFDNYFNWYAAIDSDTGLTRFLIPVYAAIALLAGGYFYDERRQIDPYEDKVARQK